MLYHYSKYKITVIMQISRFNISFLELLSASLKLIFKKIGKMQKVHIAEN